MRMVRHLGREDWVLAGLEALAAGGPAALKVEATARRLGVSKGSFYWHFRHRADWRDALLGYWEHLVFAAMVGARDRGQDRTPGVAVPDLWPSEGNRPDRAAVRSLRATGQGRPSGAFELDRLDHAFLIWSRDDAWVARAVARVQAERRGVSQARAPRMSRAA